MGVSTGDGEERKRKDYDYEDATFGIWCSSGREKRTSVYILF